MKAAFEKKVHPTVCQKNLRYWITKKRRYLTFSSELSYRVYVVERSTNICLSVPLDKRSAQFISSFEERRSVVFAHSSLALLFWGRKRGKDETLGKRGDLNSFWDGMPRDALRKQSMVHWKTKKKIKSQIGSEISHELPEKIPFFL